MGAQVVLDEQLVEAAQRLLDGEGLRHDVDAVVLVLDHLGDPAQLALEDRRAMQRTLLQVVDHVNTIPPRGILMPARR
jgi:predicted TIM-barrel fold metal-dependent hydrolase